MSKKVRATEVMWQRLFRRFDDQPTTLQVKIQDMLVHAILEGFVAPGEALASSRKLSAALEVSRSTVTLAFQHLSDMGFLQSRDRSGYFVHPEINATFLGARQRDAAPPPDTGVDWTRRLQHTLSRHRNIAKPPDWQRYQHPFVYGQYDATLFPKNDWRQCVSESLNVEAINTWAPDLIDRDDPQLIAQIQQRLLPARGIWSERDEILVTAGAQNAAFMLASLLFGPRTVVGMEDPGYPDARNIFLLHTRNLLPLRVDAQGLIVDEALDACDYLFVTPSHQCPTTVTMPLERRQALLAKAQAHDFVIIEDDHESELNFSGRPTPALKSLDTAARVIYTGSLSKTLAHGLRLGYVVAPAALIRELRALRRLILRHPASNNQLAAAMFIGHGYHESYVQRLNTVYRDRAETLRSALDRHLPEFHYTHSQGGSALWVQAPEGVNTRELAVTALQQGVVVEPGDVFFAGPRLPGNFLRMGYSSIPLNAIDGGVRELSALLRSHGRPVKPVA